MGVKNVSLLSYVPINVSNVSFYTKAIPVVLTILTQEEVGMEMEEGTQGKVGMETGEGMEMEEGMEMGEGTQGEVGM